MTLMQGVTAANRSLCGKSYSFDTVRHQCAQALTYGGNRIDAPAVGLSFRMLAAFAKASIELFRHPIAECSKSP
jgi:hypothetical protein